MNRGIFTLVDTAAAAAVTAAAAAQDAAAKAMQRANQANAAAAAAQATGTNAAASTADLAAAVASGNSTHADLYSRLANIQLTPGPGGKDGTNGIDGKAGLNGTNGTAGTNGTNGIDGKNATVTIATGMASTPLLALNATADITITLTHAMPTATYNIEPLPSAALLGNYTWTVKSKTATTVVLTIKATVALAASTLGLVAWLSA